MKKTFGAIIIFLIFCSCQNNEYRVEFEKNTEIAKAYFKLHEEENSEAMFNYLHPDMEWHMPVYGMNMGGIEDVKAAIIGYQTDFDNLKFTADYWLPGVNTETGIPDGSTRVYGTWNATHVKTGKEVNLTTYHSFEFKDGKIFRGGDWFDLGGMMNPLTNHEEEIISMVNMTTKVSASKVEDFSKKYQSLVNNLEPNSLSFRFSKTGKNRITLIERYVNSDAVINHIKNISQGGEISKDFEEFQRVFSIYEITVYGNVSDELKKAIAPFKIKTRYVPVIAGYSR